MLRPANPTQRAVLLAPGSIAAPGTAQRPNVARRILDGPIALKIRAPVKLTRIVAIMIISVLMGSVVREYLKAYHLKRWD